MRRRPLAATVQELHLVAVHMLCETFDRAVENGETGRVTADGTPAADGRPGVVGRLVGRARTVGRTPPGGPVAPRKGQT